MPSRVQRKRVKGWRMPAGTVYVGRPSRYGNPYIVTFEHGDWRVLTPGGAALLYSQKLDAQRRAVDCFEEALLGRRVLFGGRPILPFTVEDLRRELGGKDIACWCGLDQPCHGDPLLRIANRGKA